nr:MAG TPA: hypothetical protein [Caudoviricetes sp.]
MQFSKIFLKIIIYNQKSIVKDIRLPPSKKPSFPNQIIKKDLHIQKSCICKPFA